MFAVIKTGGRQYRVVAEDVLEVGKIEGEVGSIIQLGEVLVLGGDTPVLGLPMVEGATVAAEVLSHKREDHLVQEAPPQEFAPQAWLPRRDHRAADHRDPGRWQEADRRAASETREGRQAGRRRG
jgi:ribosomal protein L21